MCENNQTDVPEVLDQLLEDIDEKRFISAEAKLEAMSQEFNKERGARHLLARTNSIGKHVDARNTERACASLDKLKITTDRAKQEVENKARYARDIEDVETTLACSRF
jgi:hypothetical protein